MQCTNCQSNFEQSSRDKHLSDFSTYQNSSLCTDCIIAKITSEQITRYQQIKEIIPEYEKARKNYLEFSEKLQKLKHVFKQKDYEKNMILFSIKEHEKAKQAIHKSSPSTSTLSAEAIRTMLANLPADKRQEILASLN